MNKNIVDALPMTFKQFLSFGIAASEALVCLHAKYSYHGSVCPENIVWEPGDQKITFVNSATEIALSNKAQLPYISPEQTGRMNRTVDYRTDFYSLGALFYELLTGHQPFCTDDPLELIHLHIAKEPKPPHELKVEIPEQLSAIVMRLLEKNAEDRYQSANGLKHDLLRCQEALYTTGNVDQFELGLKDFPARFQVSQKLYGREKEASQLLAAFDEIAQGSSKLLLVTGYSGVGKTALVYETFKAIAPKNGFFLEGKFDQNQRNVPYNAWIQITNELISYLLMEDESRLAQWKVDILQALGSSGSVLIDVVPNLELIVGPQPEAPRLDGPEAQNRFNYLCQNFTKVFAKKEHPLVVFLDDLQWIDTASLNLIKIYLTDIELKYFLIIGAYRDNEVDASHPLMMSVEELIKAGVDLQILELQALSEEDVNKLVSDSLQCLPVESRSLSHLIYSKTAGNAFFIHQMLGALSEGNQLTIDESTHNWRWDMAALQTMDITENVVELVAGKMRRLPSASQEILKLAACIGNQFHVPTLAVIAQLPEQTVQTHILTALRAGIIFQINSHFRFSHDRVQHAAYLLISEADKKTTHLQIGRLLLQHIPEQDQDKRIFEIIDQFNLCQSLINDPAERKIIAELNLRAGQKAKTSIAYKAAANYYKLGINLLAGDCWQSQYQLTLPLFETAAEVLALDGKFEEAHDFTEQVLQHASSILDKVRAYETVLQAYISQGELLKAIETALPVLDQLGISLPRKPGQTDIDQDYHALKTMLANKGFEALADLPDMVDPEKLAAMRLMLRLWTATLYALPKLSWLMSMEMVRQTVEYGSAPESSVGYAFYSTHLCGVVNDIDGGTQFAKLALSLSARSEAAPYRARVHNLVYGFCLHWSLHLKDTLEPLRQVYRDGVETGDTEYAGYGIYNAYHPLLYCGHKLSDLRIKAEECIVSSKRIHHQLIVDTSHLLRQAVSNLEDCPKLPLHLSGEFIDEDEMLAHYLAIQNGAVVVILFLNKIMFAFLFEEHRKILEYVGMIEKYIPSLTSSFIVPIANFYCSLGYLDSYSESTAEQKNDHLRQVEINQNRLAFWAEHAPMNCLHKWHLVEAERHRVLGADTDTILSHYDSAIVLAHKHGYIQEEALANELATKFWLEKNKKEFAALYLNKAYTCYRLWGANSKLKQMEQQYPNLLQQTEGLLTDAPQESLDFGTAIKASQTLAGEIVLDRLLNRLMKIVVENAGAQWGCLVIQREGEWIIEATNDIDNSEVKVLQSIDVDRSDLVSSGIINYVARTHDNVVLNNAASEGDFIRDPHIQRCQSKSILCIPLINQSRVSAILYLENNRATGAFTPDRLGILEIISAQAAISLENAMLFDSIQEEIRERKRVETELRESESHYRSLFDNSLYAIVVTGPDYKFKEVNSAFCRLLEYDEDELIGKIGIADITHPDDVEKSRGKIKQLVAREIEDFILEKRYVTKSGKVIDAIIYAQGLYDENGQYTGSPATIMDVTDLKQAHEELRQHHDHLDEMVNQRTAELAESEVRFRGLSEATFEGIIIHDKGMIIEANQSAVEMLGYKRDELIGQHSRNLLTSESWDSVVQHLPDKYEGSYEVKGVRKDKTIFPVEVHAKQIPYQGQQMRVVALRDITERKQYEEQLQKSEKRLKEAQHIAKIGRWKLDLRLNKLDWSDEVFHMFEIDKSEFTASYEAFLEAIHPDDREKVNSAYTQSLKDKRPYEITHRLLMKDGRIKYVRELCDTQYADDGNALYSSGVVQDITGLVQTENQLKEANTKLKELDKLKSMFIASMSHELRTPLNSIIGFTSILLQDILGELNERQRDSLERVQGAGRHLLSLITDIIDISKIEAGRIDAYIETFSLEELVSEAVDSFRLQAQKKQIKLVVEAESWPVMNSDRMRLLQCLLNLLSNAVKYSEAGTVTVQVSEHNQMAQIAVSDMGIGIAEQDMKKLFVAFDRFESHLRIKAGGTGLGLYLTKKIVTNVLQGKVSAESRLGEGSTFCLTIPTQCDPRKAKDVNGVGYDNSTNY
ncbi:MAG: PAS domain S-box protein [Candidatus Thiodiazotropha sp. (ex. Lucinisca nassula)]|nr:PAS domain S-box protein [Candidatus Thiodiazotropha sp. (ex. Lucinisca nassula)]